MKKVCLFLTFCLTVSAWSQDVTPYLYDNEENNPVNIQPSYSFRVVLDPKERTVLSAELNSPVVKIYKRMGDSFVPGEVLMTLDSKVAEGNYGKAIAKRDKALLELEGKKKLFTQDLISLFEVTDAEAAYADALAEAIAAEKLLSATKIKASYKGKVVRLGIEEHELAQAGKELIETVREDFLLGRFLAPAGLVSCLGLGTEITLNVNGQEKKTTITRISPVIDPASGTIKVETEFNNEDTHWIPGTIGTATIACQAKDFVH